MKKELLAPAGDLEAGYAAFYYGADAVYLGLQQFSARATATNFDETALGELTAYAHSLNRKVFVAINTLAQEAELEDLLKSLDICRRTMVDAVIIQDIGVARIVREQYPELEMHASTQMAVHNKEGALALKNIGFKRVVVARELSLSEIQEIAQIPDLDIETFIHGALCYSYSGVCLFSSMTTGKSANRGKCLYPCRAEFVDEQGKEQHFFSMKDMALEEDVLKLPVLSLKIEGRKKTALYVAAVTDYYRRILDGQKADKIRAQNIKQIFSRPWCRFHLNGKNKDVVDRDFVGHRGLLVGKIEKVSGRSITLKSSNKIEKHDGIQIDVPKQEKPFGFSVLKMRVNGKPVFESKAGEVVEIMVPPHDFELTQGLNVYLASASNVKGAYPYSKPKPREFRPLHDICVEVTIEPSCVIAQSGETKVKISGQFEEAKNFDKADGAVVTAFEKTGDTNFFLRDLRVRNPKKLFIPVSILNELRRSLYAQIEPEVCLGQLPDIAEPLENRKGQWIIKTDNPQTLAQINMDDVAEVIILLSSQSDCSEWQFIPHEKIRLALPTVCRNVTAFLPKIKEFLSAGYKKWEIGNYWGLSVLPVETVDLSFDYPIYQFNSQAIMQAKEAGAKRICLSPEDTPENWQQITGKSALPIVLPVYEDVALFTSAVCIRDNACKDCDRLRKVIPLRRGRDGYLAVSENCQTIMLADNPFCIASDALKFKVDFYRVSFIHKEYSGKEVFEIWQKLRRFSDVTKAHKGNMSRKI